MELTELEIDIFASVFHSHNPNVVGRIAEQLGESRATIIEEVHDSVLLKYRHDDYISRESFTSDVGRWQYVYPFPETCDQCGDEIEVFGKRYLIIESPVDKDWFCESCVKKMKMLEGLDNESS